MRICVTRPPSMRYIECAANYRGLRKLIQTRHLMNSMLIEVLDNNKTDESTARRQLKSPQSLYGRSIHLTLVTKWSSSWSWFHEWPTTTPFVQCQSAHPFWDTAISKIDHENPWSRSCVRSKVKVTFDLQKSKVKVMVKVKHIGHSWGLGFNRYVCFSSVPIGPFLADK